MNGDSVLEDGGGKRSVESNCLLQEDPNTSCKICGNVAVPSFTKKGHLYYLCLNCGIVFTLSVDKESLVTENDNSSQRNNRADNTERIRRIDAYGNGGKDILDFGCGEGLFMKFLNDELLTVPKHKCIGIDQRTELQLNHVKDRSVDAVSLVEVIEHLFEPQAIFREFRRILRPGGIVYVETSILRIQTDPMEFWYLDPTYGHCTIHTLESLSVLAEKCGFVFSVYNFNVFLFTVPK